MPAKLSPFEIHFEIIFLENYVLLKPPPYIHPSMFIRQKMSKANIPREGIMSSLPMRLNI
jgi:hypothetical protein